MSKMHIEAGELKNLLSKVKDTVGTGRLSQFDTYIKMTIQNHIASTGQGDLVLTTTNDVDSSTLTYAVDCDGDIEFPIVPYKRLFDLIGTFNPATQLELSMKGFDLILEWSKAKPMKIAGIDRASFIELQFFDQYDSFSIPMSILHDSVEALSPYSTPSDHAPVLGCLNAIFTDKNIVFEAIDSRTSTMSYAKHLGITATGYRGNFFVSFQHIKKSISKFDPSAPVTINVSNSCIELVQPNYSIIFKRFSGVFPKCSDLFPTQFVTTLRVDADASHEVLTRASVLTNARRSMFELIYSAQGFGIDVKSELGTLSESIPGVVSGFSEFKAFCSIDQLLKLFKQAKGAVVDLYSPSAKMLVVEPDGYPFEFRVALPCNYEVTQDAIDHFHQPDTEATDPLSEDEMEAIGEMAGEV